MNDRPRCNALTRAGDQCQKRAMAGRDVCKAHSGDTYGRPTKLTPKTIDTVVRAIKRGAYRDEAAIAAGVHRATLYHWLERGEADQEAGTRTVFADLRDALTRAEAEAETTAVDIIRRQMSGDWRAAAWYLERKFPARWGRRLEVQHGGDIDLGKPRIVAPEEDERRGRIAAILASAGALDGAAAENTTNEETPDGTND